MWATAAAAGAAAAGSHCSAAHVYTPAQLTWRRSALVNNLNLARAAAAAGLDRQLSARSRQLVKLMKKFVDATMSNVSGSGQQIRRHQHQQSAIEWPVDGEVEPMVIDEWDAAENMQGWPVVAAADAAAASDQEGLDLAKMEDDKIWDEVWSANAEHKQALDNGHEDVHTPAPSAPKVLADVVESVIGAVFVDSTSSSSRQGAGRRSSDMQQVPNTSSSSGWEAAWEAAQQLLLRGKDQQHLQVASMA